MLIKIQGQCILKKITFLDLCRTLSNIQDNFIRFLNLINCLEFSFSLKHPSNHFRYSKNDLKKKTVCSMSIC